MKKIITTLTVVLCLIIGFTANAEAPQEITLTVSSDGPTKDDATKNALRSAIEQAYGVFVSANTTILNDELVKDEIVTVSNGSIKSFEEISAISTKDGGYFVTLSATVSLPTLVKYAQSHGSECEFAGNTFGMEMKLWEMQKENELKAIQNLKNALCSMTNLCDYKMYLKEPVVFNNDVNIDFQVEILANKNTDLFLSTLFGTLEGLSAFEEQRNQKINKGDKTGYKTLYNWEFRVKGDGNEYLPIFLRNKESLKILNSIKWYLLNQLITSFSICDNTNSPSKLNIREPFLGDDKKYLENYNWDIAGRFYSSNEKNLQKNIDKEKKKFFKKNGRNVYVFPEWHYYTSGYAYRLMYYKGFDIGNKQRSRRLKIGLDGRFTIPKEEISKYSKFWVEPINK